MSEVVLIGLGGANGIVADVLTAAGIEVVALEAGGRVSPSEMILDEVLNDRRERLGEAKSLGEAPTWRATSEQVAGPSPWPAGMANAVGGSTVHYPALCQRLFPWNFRARTATIERYGERAIPVDSTLVDWPITYDELEPFYCEVEDQIGIAGCGDENPFEGPRSAPLPMPPLRSSGWTELTSAAARELGWHPYPAPAALNSLPRHGRRACTYCGFCAFNGCYADAKNHTGVTHIPRAEASGRLRIVTGARVTRIEASGGRVTGVAYVHDGEERVQRAGAVVLGTFVYENSRLLLLSDVANASGQVGKHFTAHVTPIVHGLFSGKDLGLFGGPWSQAVCIDDFNADAFDHSELGFISGGMSTAFQELKPIQAAGVTPPPGVDRWGAAWKDWIVRNARSVGTLVAQFDALPYHGHRLDLDPTARDAHGLPVIRATFGPRENELRGSTWLADRLHEWLRQAGATQTWLPGDGRAPVEARHAFGGTRMGDDPATSVVDRYGFAHELDNLAVVGASTFAGAGGSNPTLTVQALALRTARHLVETWDERVR